MLLVKIWQCLHLFILRKIGQEFHPILQRKTPFQNIKTTSPKKSKNWDFSKGTKGVSPWFWSKMINFSVLLFSGKNARKMCFTIFQKEKTSFYAKKTRSSKSRKFVFFAKGLVHDFGQKLAIFPSVYFRQHRPGKCVSRYSRMKKHFSRPLKQQVKRVEKLKFSQRGKSMVLLKNCQFLNSFIVG